MAEKPHPTHRRTAAERVRDADTVALDLPVLGHIRIPHAEELAYYGGLGALAALQIIDWPVALAIAVGHALAHNHRSRIAQELGAALEEA